MKLLNLDHTSIENVSNWQLLLSHIASLLLEHLL